MNYPSARERAIAAARNMLPLPQGAVQVLAMLASWDCDLKRVAGVIEKDPVLAMRVLSVANSAAFSRGRSIVDVRHAVTMLGIVPLRAYAIGWTILNMFKRMRTPEFWDHKGFIAHSVATACLTEQLVDALAHAQKQEAYVAGLVHDIGKLILAVHLPDEYGRVIAAARVTERPLRELELDQIGIDHAELSGIAGHQWKLPESVCTAVRFHHTPWLDPCCDVPLSLLISQADAFLNTSQLPLQEAGETSTEILNLPCRQAEADTALKAFWRIWPMMRSLLAC